MDDNSLMHAAVREMAERQGADQTHQQDQTAAAHEQAQDQGVQAREQAQLGHGVDQRQDLGQLRSQVTAMQQAVASQDATERKALDERQSLKRQELAQTQAQTGEKGDAVAREATTRDAAQTSEQSALVKAQDTQRQQLIERQQLEQAVLSQLAVAATDLQARQQHERDELNRRAQQAQPNDTTQVDIEREQMEQRQQQERETLAAKVTDQVAALREMRAAVETQMRADEQRLEQALYQTKAGPERDAALQSALAQQEAGRHELTQATRERLGNSADKQEAVNARDRDVGLQAMRDAEDRARASQAEQMTAQQRQSTEQEQQQVQAREQAQQGQAQAQQVEAVQAREQAEQTAEQQSLSVGQIAELRSQVATLTTLSDEALQRVAREAQFGVDRAKGQILEEHLAQAIELQVAQENKSRDADHQLEFIRGDRIRDSQNAKLSDGIIAQRVGDRLVVIQAYEAKSGAPSARELYAKVHALSKDDQLETWRYARDLAREDLAAEMEQARKSEADKVAMSRQEQMDFLKNRIDDHLDELLSHRVQSEKGGQVLQTQERLDVADRLRIDGEEVALANRGRVDVTRVVPQDVRKRDQEALHIAVTAKQLEDAAQAVVDALRRAQA